MEIVINEGRNRQVRRMTAAVDLPTLRLVRAKVGDWSVDGLSLGKYKVENITSPNSSRPLNKQRQQR
jgi:23S rRNA pseudouridine2457 synthase